jgi:Sulfotransferase family
MPGQAPATLDTATLLEAARARAGIAEFDNESFVEGLDILVADVNRSTLLSDGGRDGLRKIFIQLLVNRLRVAHYLREHPDTLAQPVPRPVFVIGAPRTGTTLVNHLLGADPARRSLLKWEIRNSVPPPGKGALRTDPRCLAMKAKDAARPEALRGSTKQHFEAADGPSECTFLHAQDFKSQFLEALLPVPAYSRWIMSCDMTSAYTYQKKVLQLLQTHTGGIWNLKMPSHALHIDALLRVFPDARIVWTHRDPLTALGSLCSTVAATQSSFCTSVDTDYIGRVYAAQLAAHLDRPLAARDAARGDSFHDLDYAAVTADPIGEMRRLYVALGDPFTAEAEAGMRAWLHENPQHRLGKHSYTLAQYGLTEAGVRPLFAHYYARFPEGSVRG